MANLKRVYLKFEGVSRKDFKMKAQLRKWNISIDTVLIKVCSVVYPVVVGTCIIRSELECMNFMLQCSDRDPWT